MSELVCEKVSISYKKTMVLLNVSLTVSSGSIIGITGDNGSGKSTLAGIAAGVIKPDGGVVRLDGRNITGIRDLPGYIGYMPQRDPLPDMFTVKECLNLWSPSEERTESLVRQYGFSDILRKKVCKLSAGTRRRLSFACCVASDPGIIILDEPTAALDESTSSLIRRDMIRMKEAGAGIMLITHDKEEINICNDCYRIKDGINEKI